MVSRSRTRQPPILASLRSILAARQQLRAAALNLHSRWAARGRGPESTPVPLEADCRYCCLAAAGHWNLGRVATTHPGPFERSEYHLMQCTCCDVVYLDPLPTTADLDRLYLQSDQFSAPIYSDPVKADRLVAYYGRRLKRLGLLPGPPALTLEVGAGLAWVSRAIKREARGVETWAQDPSPECARKCPWVDVYEVGPIEAIDPLPRFALISLTHVIEHVPDPNQFLGEIARRLQPAGSIFMTAPFRPAGWKPGGSLAAWRDYSYLHVPAHIAYLSRAWLERAATHAGLELVHWEDNHDGHQAFEAVLRAP